VVSESASAEQVEKLWWSFQRLSGAFVKVLREYPGLAVSSFAWTDNKSKPKENMKDLLWSTSTRHFRKWLPPAETWDWFKRLATGQDRDQTIEIRRSKKIGKDCSWGRREVALALVVVTFNARLQGHYYGKCMRDG
jgi:hypothetical protein